MKPSLRFLNAVIFVLDHETVFKRGHHGDYAFAIAENVSGDPGGVTKFGIDQRSHPELNIRDLTLLEAREIYHRQYWAPCLADEMPLGYGEVLFDIKVNGGNGPEMLQKALNRVIDGAPLKVDGALGPKSIAAMNKTGKEGLMSFLNVRQERYNTLAKKPNFQQFLKGWTNRNDDLRRFVSTLLANA